MIDLNHLEKYTENNRIEAKKALGGLPHSIWETYSAFANALGGIILLGVEEYKDKTLHTVDLPDPEALVKEFWDAVNDPAKASVNLLTKDQVRIETVNGDRIIVIEVPRAPRCDKPVFVGGDPVGGSYRRNGEGDHRCTAEELASMQRDADIRTQDMRLIEGMDSTVLSAHSIAGYRQCLQTARPEHPWADLPDDEFLLKIGAADTGKDGRVHPTAAGLLMFGAQTDIQREYPAFSLSYTDKTDDTPDSGGLFCGSVFDFYQHIIRLLPESVPGSLSFCRMLREALANCLVNADYYGHGGISVIRERSRITMSNPGDFRVELDDAYSGGQSDPRNGILMKMFNLIDIGEHAGSGIPNIWYVWRLQGLSEPSITQSFDPDRITLTLPLTKRARKKPDADGGQNIAVSTGGQKAVIIDYLTDRAEGTAAELAKLLGIRQSQVKLLLGELIFDGIVAARGDGRSRSYKLKA